MNPSLFLEVPFDADEAWEEFGLNHGITHQTVYRKLLEKNLVPEYLDLFVFPRDDNATYLLDHWLVHRSNARLLGLTGIPDLSVCNLDEPAQYSDWMLLHSEVHQAEYAALGLI